MKISVTSILNYFFPLKTKSEKAIEQGNRLEEFLHRTPVMKHFKYQHRVSRLFSVDGKEIEVVGVIDFYDPVSGVIIEAKKYSPQLRAWSSYRKRVEYQISFYYHLLRKPRIECFLLIIYDSILDHKPCEFDSPKKLLRFAEMKKVNPRSLESIREMIENYVKYSLLAFFQNQ